jgi:hypothetical protein
MIPTHHVPSQPFSVAVGIVVAHCLAAVINLLRTDLPAAGGLVTFPDPVNPPSRFGGAGGAPLTETTLDIMVSVLAGTPNIN